MARGCAVHFKGAWLKLLDRFNLRLNKSLVVVLEFLNSCCFGGATKYCLLWWKKYSPLHDVERCEYDTRALQKT